MKEGGSASVSRGKSRGTKQGRKAGARSTTGGGMRTPGGGTPGMNDLNDIDEREQGDDDEDDNDVDDIMQTKGMSEVNIMMRGADGIMNRDDQLKYKKILEKSKMQNHKPTKEHLMFGVIPNWDSKWTWTADAQESQIKPEKMTREWHIIDHSIKNIHKNESKGMDRDFDED